MITTLAKANIFIPHTITFHICGEKYLKYTLSITFQYTIEYG